MENTSYTLYVPLRRLEVCYDPAKEPVNGQYCDENSYPFACLSFFVSILGKHTLPINLALRGQFGLIHAVAAVAAAICTMCKFVDHHALEDVGLLLSVHQQVFTIE